MNLEKVIFGFFIIFACTLNFGFFIGDLERPELHHPMELFAVVVVSLSGGALLANVFSVTGWGVLAGRSDGAWRRKRL